MDAIDKNNAASEADSEPNPAGALAVNRVRKWTIAICAALLIAFATLAWSAVRGKSPTVDEGYHALAGWLHLWKGDYRVDCEDPPLWNMLAAMIAPPGLMRIDPASLSALDMPVEANGVYLWCAKTLYHTPGNDGPSFVRRFRAVMLIVGILLGCLIAAFSWRLANSLNIKPTPAAAATVFATALFAFDPNFLAHSALVKNDVASSLALLGLTASTWSVGRAITLRKVLVLGVCAGIALLIKFNGPILVSTSATLLLVRPLLRWPWPAPGKQLWISRASRLVASTVVLSVMVAISLAMIWVAYGLRFEPSRQPTAGMNMPDLMNTVLIKQWQDQHTDGIDIPLPSMAQVLAMPRPLVIRVVNWANERRLLPQPFLAGLCFVYQGALMRPAFVFGQTRSRGVRWYFPLAMAVKTPIASLAAFASVFIFIVWNFRSRGGGAKESSPAGTAGIWTGLCLGLPVLIYLSSAMASDLNLGIRHILPIYPLLFISAGLVLAKAWGRRRSAALAGGLIVFLGLASEAALAYPNFIPFFNAFAGGDRGGLSLLSDSNLDWGQDLPLLAQWQREHSHVKLYLAYFGTADPDYFGIRYTKLIDGFAPQPITAPGVIAISATILQGTYSENIDRRPYWAVLWRLKPFEVLGGSIYLFHVPPSPADRLPSGESLID